MGGVFLRWWATFIRGVARSDARASCRRCPAAIWCDLLRLRGNLVWAAVFVRTRGVLRRSAARPGGRARRHYRQRIELYLRSVLGWSAPKFDRPPAQRAVYLLRGGVCHRSSTIRQDLVTDS